MMVITASKRILQGFLAVLTKFTTLLLLNIVDTTLTLLNTVLPTRGIKPAHIEGEKSIWSPFIAPSETDSRSPCPALNAMANHGILPHDGRNIPFRQITEAIRETYNFSYTFSWFVPHYAATMLNRSYLHGTVNLGDLCVHNGIEHDASLTRRDIFEAPDQSKPDSELIDRLLNCATGRDRKTGQRVLTNADVARFSHIRRTESQKANPQFTLSTFHKIFGSNNSATMTSTLGGKVDDLEIWLKEERLPEGYRPYNRHRFGMTMGIFNLEVFGIELRIPNEPYNKAETK